MDAAPDELHPMQGTVGVDLGDEEERPMQLELITRFNNLALSVNCYNGLRLSLPLPKLGRQRDRLAEARMKSYHKMVKKDMFYQRNAIIYQMFQMLRQGIQPIPTPPLLDRRTGDVLIRPSIFVDVCRRFVGGVGEVMANIAARAARKAAAAAAAAQAAQAGPAAAQATQAGPAAAAQAAEDNAGPPSPRRSRRHQR